MNGLKHAIVLALAILAFILLAATVLQGAGDKNDAARWENLRNVAPGSNVRVVLKNVQTHEGKLRSVTDEGLRIQTSDGERTFARDTVARVSAKGRAHRKRNLLIGMGLGAATGAIVAVADPELGQGVCEQGSCVNAGTVSAVTFGGAAAGSVVGAAIPTGRWHEVFRAPVQATARAGGMRAVPRSGRPASSPTASELARQ